MLLIFDCDGVIVDSMPLHNEVESEVYRTIGINLKPEELAKRFAGISQAEEFKILEQEMGIKIPPDIGTQLDLIKERVFAEHLKAIPGIQDAIKNLHGIPRCIASGTRQERLKEILKIVGLYDQFMPHLYSADMVEKGKPHPDLFLYAAQKIGHDPADCLVIEDAVSGVQAGKAAGMRVFGFIGGSHCDAEHGQRLKAEGAEIIFSDMRELPSLIEQFSEPKLRSAR